MSKILFLLCPTDCLETTVNNTFVNENYFYTSLGNSFIVDVETLNSIKELILKHNIQYIYFVLSNENQIILDALERQYFSKFKGLKTFYNEISKQKKDSEFVWGVNDKKDLIISYFLNYKIEELQKKLDGLSLNSIKVRGKVYDKYENVFKNIYSSLTCLKKHSLN